MVANAEPMGYRGRAWIQKPISLRLALGGPFLAPRMLSEIAACTSIAAMRTEQADARSARDDTPYI